jgi:hypothetical protein
MSMNVPASPVTPFAAFGRDNGNVLPMWRIPRRSVAASLVENIGVEPMTSCVQGRRSSQLS